MQNSANLPGPERPGYDLPVSTRCNTCLVQLPAATTHKCWSCRQDHNQPRSLGNHTCTHLLPTQRAVALCVRLRMLRHASLRRAGTPHNVPPGCAADQHADTSASATLRRSVRAVMFVCTLGRFHCPEMYSACMRMWCPQRARLHEAAQPEWVSDAVQAGVALTRHRQVR